MIDYLPIWSVFIIFVVVALICVESGFHQGLRRRESGAHEPEAAVGTMLASTLALLAFVLGFTFSIAAGRFDDRRAAVLAESNAIGTAYLRADFLDEPSKGHVKELLRKYVDLRRNPDPRTMEETIKQSESLQQELWKEAVDAGTKHPNSLTSALFISNLNEMIDIQSKRVTAGLHARVPLIVWICLLLVSILTMNGIGYSCGLAGHRSLYGTTILTAAFGLVLVLAADLDRPLEGLIRTPQQPMIELQRKLLEAAAKERS